MLLMEYVMIEDENKWLLVIEDARGSSLKRKCFWMRDSYFCVVNDLINQLNRAFVNAGGYENKSTTELPLAIESFSQICKRLNKFTKIYKNCELISLEVEVDFSGEKRVINIEDLYTEPKEDMSHWFACIGYSISYDYGRDYNISALKIPVNISYNNIYKNMLYFYNIYYDEFKSESASLSYKIAELFEKFFGYEILSFLDVLKLRYQSSNRVKKVLLDYANDDRPIHCEADGTYHYTEDINEYNIYYKRQFSLPYLKGSIDKEKLESVIYPNKQEVTDFLKQIEVRS